MARWICILLASLALWGQEARLQVVTTSDVHGRVAPVNPSTLQPADQGWAQLATRIKALRQKNPNMLLVDAGDALQGDPASYVRARVRPDMPEPALASMTHLGYHALVVGNHDFDWGLPYLRAQDEAAAFPFLAANIQGPGGQPAFQPYVVHDIAGVRVGLLGLCTSALERIAEPGMLGGLRVADAVETARIYLPRLREQEKVDVVVVALHAGLGAPEAALGAEHQGHALLGKVPGIDLLILGHSHQSLATRVNGVPVLQAPAQGQGLAVADLILRKEGSAWRVTSAEPRLEPLAAGTVPDPEVLALTAPLRAFTDTYLDTLATTLAVDLDGRWARMEDGAIAQLLHAVQRKATGAQLSAAAPPSMRYFVAKGPVSVRALWPLAPYENRVARIRLTGAQVKAWLEHAARFYAFSHQPQLFNPEVAGHDFDVLDGVTYALDISKPVGQRVADLRFQGRPVQPLQAFTMAISTYRLGDGGGYMTAVGLPPGEAEMVTPATLRNLLLAFVISRPVLDLPLQNHWRIIPWLDRERVWSQAR